MCYAVRTIAQQNAAVLLLCGALASVCHGASPPASGVQGTEPPLFTRHVEAVFSRLGCNGGTCHGAVQGRNGFRLSLFSGNPEQDYDQLVNASRGRRVWLAAPEQSLLLLKPTGQTPHKGGVVTTTSSPEFAILRDWVEGGARRDAPADSQIAALRVTPSQHTGQVGQQYPLHVEAAFADGTREDVTSLCLFDTLDKEVATVTRDGLVEVRGVGDTSLLVRYRSEPVMAALVVPSQAPVDFPAVVTQNFIDQEVLAKLRLLNIPPSELADDATFLRRACLDVAGEMPTPSEIRTFLADTSPNKRGSKIDELLERPGHAAVWTLKFCDLLRASDFGVYADGLKLEDDAPRFQQWVRARLEENLPYDQFVERILTATSREGRTLEAWSAEVLGLHAGANKDRADLALYSQRKTLDLYWQRKAATGVSGGLQVAHTFLGLRLECAQCHRHPHDIWQQDDLLSFSNFFMHVRAPGFEGDNEKKYPELAAIDKQFQQEGKQLLEAAKKLKETDGKRLEEEARRAKGESDKLKGEIRKLQQQIDKLTSTAQKPADISADKAAELASQTQAAQAELDRQQQALAALAEPELAYDKFKQQVADMERRGQYLPEAGKRILHAEIRHLPDAKAFASVTSPLGTQSSQTLRLLGESQAIELPADADPRLELMAWLRRKDNPYFAKAIVNRIWAHYFGRGIIDPPDQLSPLNPATHPQLLDELCRQFVEHGYDLKWLHRTILSSHTYQQSSVATAANRVDRTNYAYFYYRRLPAEVLLDALNQATGTTENMDMAFYRWPAQLKTVEIPSAPRNAFVTFMLENFGRPARNSGVQCDCQRDSNASVLQVLTLANHPRVRQKVADPKGEVARILREITDDALRIEELYLVALSRLPSGAEQQACQNYVKSSPSAEAGLQGILWGLVNTREFMLQH